MAKNDYCIINNATYSVWTVCNGKEISEEIADAIRSDKEDVKFYSENVRDGVDVNWNKARLEEVKKELKAGYRAVTHDEYDKLMRDKYLSREPIEITEEDYEEMLNCLPPMLWIRNERYSMFFNQEGYYYIFHSHYIHDKINNKFFVCQAVPSEPETWIDKRLNLRPEGATIEFSRV